MDKELVKTDGIYRIITLARYDEYKASLRTKNPIKIQFGFVPDMTPACGLLVKVNAKREDGQVLLETVDNIGVIPKGFTWSTDMLIDAQLKVGDRVKIINVDGGQESHLINTEAVITRVYNDGTYKIDTSDLFWGPKRLQLLNNNNSLTKKEEKMSEKMIKVPYTFVLEHAKELNSEQRAFVKANYDIFAEQISEAKIREFMGLICAAGRDLLVKQVPELVETKIMLGGTRAKELQALEVALENALGISHHTSLIVADSHYSEGDSELTNRSIYITEGIEVIVKKRRGGGVLLSFKKK